MPYSGVEFGSISNAFEATALVVTKVEVTMFVVTVLVVTAFMRCVTFPAK